LPIGLRRHRDQHHRQAGVRTDLAGKLDGKHPSWIRDGVFGFFPFHGGPEWGSFPLGHTTIVATTATILWLVWPELRVVWGAIVAMVAAGLIAGNYHFLSDIIGGLYLGVPSGS
jgi:membrane-associated phospholipid phosphatase